MRYMIIVKGTEASERGGAPGAALTPEVQRYHEELARAGVLLDGSGLQPTSEGWKVKYHDGERTVEDGPFPGAKELVAGYTLIDVRSREEALEWSRRFPNPRPDGGDFEIEVRPLP